MAMKKRTKIFIKIMLIVFIVIISITTITAITNGIVYASLKKTALSFSPVVYDDARPRLEVATDADGNKEFTTDREFKVMQLTDIHIGGGYMSAKKDKMALNAIATMVEAEKPDLIIVTGDMVYPVPFQAGTFNNMNSTKIFASFMDNLGVYWTIALGNHDSEIYSYSSRKSIAKQYASDKYTNSIFTMNPQGFDNIDGYGNQLITVYNSQKFITQSIYIFDSHSYTDGDYFGIAWKYDNIKQSQIDWYEKKVLDSQEYNKALIKEKAIDTSIDTTIKSNPKSLAFFHIPLPEHKLAWLKLQDNELKDIDDCKYIYGVAKEKGGMVYPGVAPAEDIDLFEKMLELNSTQGIFNGHDHLNNFQIEYKGIRLTYGLSIDYLAYPGISKKGEQRGCTIININPDGSFISVNENYYQDKYSKTKYEKEKVTME